jgi:hypothetical protein
MCAAVATYLGHPHKRVITYQIACLLHDLGRAGLDRHAFGQIWSWAKRRGVPTRPREWRAAHPDTPYGYETEAFVARHRQDLGEAGIVVDEWATEQIEMRLGYARRLARRLREVKPSLKRLGVPWAAWMGQVILYYYYPEKLNGSPSWVRQLAEILVACEQFEAFSNRQRGRDYYTRSKESFAEAFAYLDRLHEEGILSRTVIDAVKQLAAEGVFDGILAEARGSKLTRRDLAALRGSAIGGESCR